MAKVTLVIEDIKNESGEDSVSMSSSLEGFEFTGVEPLPGSMIFGLAMKNLFQGQWLSKNVDKIVHNHLEGLKYE
jgi:hypothetical protein